MNILDDALRCRDQRHKPVLLIHGDARECRLGATHNIVADQHKHIRVLHHCNVRARTQFLANPDFQVLHHSIVAQYGVAHAFEA